MKISIPIPCNEDWDKMTPKEKGSFCSSCSKIVVDFTKMKRDEIKQYFIDKKEEKTCGRFTESQLANTVNPIPNSSFLHKFAFALYLAFGFTLFSCAQNSNHHIVGEIEPVMTDTIIAHQDSIKIDTIKNITIPLQVTPIEPIVKGDVVAEPIEYYLGEPAIEIKEEEPIEEPIKHPVKMGKVRIDD